MHYVTSEPVQATLPPHKTIIVLIDPISTSCRIAQEISKRGHHVLALWTSKYAGDSSDKRDKRSPAKYGCGGLRYKLELEEGRDWNWEDDAEGGVEGVLTIVNGVAATFGLKIVGCIAGSGWSRANTLADALAEKLGLPPRLAAAPEKNRDVRNKNTQQELLKESGLRCIRQVCGSELDGTVTEFLEAETYPVVVKPASKSDGKGASIKLCRTKKEAVDHFTHLIESAPGKIEVICQEYLRGTEIIVDNVSYNSTHKTCMVFKYDKRPANGERNVYFAMIPVESDSPEASVAIPYVRNVLDVFGVVNGPTHAECILTEDGQGPVLVELSIRPHGGDGSWSALSRALTGGYSQIEASVDAMLDPMAFEQMPNAPPSPFLAYGLQVHLISYSAGEVIAAPGFEVIKRLPSFASLSSSVGIGSNVEYTVDLLTSPGVCLLLNKDQPKLNKDLEYLRYTEEINALFVYKTRVESLARPTAATFGNAHQRIKSMEKPSLLRIFSNDRPELARQGLMKKMTTVDASKEVVVVTDPYSTGCLIVNEMISRGYNVIALWTLGFSEEMKTHTPTAAGKMKYYAEITECESLADTVQTIYKAAGNLRVVACLAGGEAGVDCADIVSERMSLRTNGTGIPNRRDKKVQQEIIRDAGMRSVRQAAGKKFEDVEAFLKSEQYPVVVKPTDSAGSDGVKLCHNFEEAKEHFNYLFEVEAVNGGFNTEVLCQEFLRGKEYVIDQVSRDGIHKTMMVWVYDKRHANNSAFVYFGMVPVDPSSMEARILIPYARGVLDALGVKNGPSHAEVILTSSGPCLVEMNVRAHGGDGNWRSLARGLTGGYSQVEVTVDSYLDKKQFSIIPNLPPTPFKSSGQEIILVSFSRGKVIATPGYDIIRKLPSFVYMETGIKIGSFVERTVDLLTGIGSVILMHSDKDILESDIAKIREIEVKNELFEYERPGAMIRAASDLNLMEVAVNTGDGF
mmetsp:Transcript_22510/g.45033  ORF Transcript_22510/g.45033 Transcript_22510/m.45033 type:complete len:968 (+) Transcript_22510:360-3263(+)